MSEEKEIPIQEEHFDTGPFSMLLDVVRHNGQILISCRNNRKVLGKLKAFDRHLNMVLEDVCETWLERPKGGKSKAPVTRER